MQFVAPSICLLSGMGAALLLDWIRPPTLRRKLLLISLIGLVGCAIAPQVVSSRFPYRMLYDHQARQFSRWFWAEQARDADLLCFDLDASNGNRGAWCGRKAWYLCNQMIYSPPRRGVSSARVREISVDHPLRCVLFEESPESPLFQGWRGRIERDLVLTQAKVYEVPVTLGEGRPTTEQWRVFEFVPRSPQATARIGAQSRQDECSADPDLVAADEGAPPA